MSTMTLWLMADAGRALGLSTERVRQLVGAGRLRVVARTPGPAGVRLLSPADVEAFRAERERRRAGAAQ